MADNINVTPGTGSTIAADEIGGVLHQRIKVVIGADGVSNGDISASNPMPVTGPLTDTQLRATTVPVSGTVTSNIGTTNGLALDASLGTLNTSVNTLLKPASTLAAVTAITNTVTVKADTAINQTTAFKTDGSATTQPVSAAALPLPAGASTSANQTTSNTKLDTLHADLLAGVPAIATLNSTYGPDPSSYVLGTSTINVDEGGALKTRGQVLTDEHSFRDNFNGSSLISSLTGTLTFTNASTQVTGSGTLFTTEIQSGHLIRLNTDAETALAEVDYVESDTVLYLLAPRAGATGSGASSKTNWATTTGAGSSMSVATSILNINMPVTTGITTSIYKSGDYGPLKVAAAITLSARRASQTFQFGLQDVVGAPTIGAYFEFNGIINTTVNCVTMAGVDSVQTTVVTIPTDTSATAHRYEISLTDDSISFLIDGIIIASHRDHIAAPYDVLQFGVTASNSALVAGTTTFSADYIHFKNFDQVEASTASSASPLIVQPAAGSQFRYLPTAGTTVLKTGSCRLLRVICGTNASNGHTLTLYDNTAGSGAIIAVFTTAGSFALGTTAVFDLNLSKGLTAVTVGTSSWTVIFR